MLDNKDIINLEHRQIKDWGIENNRLARNKLGRGVELVFDSAQDIIDEVGE